MNRGIKALKKLGWNKYLNDDFHWRYGAVNRYIDIDPPYIDIYNFVNLEKYGGYLSIDELNAVALLIQDTNLPKGEFGNEKNN